MTTLNLPPSVKHILGQEAGRDLERWVEAKVGELPVTQASDVEALQNGLARLESGAPRQSRR